MTLQLINRVVRVFAQKHLFLVDLAGPSASRDNSQAYTGAIHPVRPLEKSTVPRRQGGIPASR